MTHLADSIVELSEYIYGIDFVCMEPRGGNRQRKILRAEIEDISILQDRINSYGIRNIGLCIDIAQLFIVHDSNGAADFLEELRTINLPVKEFHVSDVIQNTKVKNRVAMEVGTGAIDWKLILPFPDFSIEVNGKIKVIMDAKNWNEDDTKDATYKCLGI